MLQVVVYIFFNFCYQDLCACSAFNFYSFKISLYIMTMHLCQLIYMILDWREISPNLFYGLNGNLPLLSFIVWMATCLSIDYFLDATFSFSFSYSYIIEIKILDRKKVRRAKLYYLRDRVNALKKWGFQLVSRMFAHVDQLGFWTCNSCSLRITLFVSIFEKP